MSLPGARLPRPTHPEVSGVVPRAACRRSVGSGFTAPCGVDSQPPATAGWWPPTFATMMHRPCDASCCFQTDRFGQRGSHLALVSVMVDVAPDAPHRSGGVDRVAALARDCTVRGSANADDASRRPRQRSDWLGVRRASSADRRAGRGKVHEARIAVDFSESPAEDGDSG